MSESIVEDLDDLIAGLGSEVIQDVGPGGEACNLNIATQEMYGYSIDAGNECTASQEMWLGSGTFQFNVPVAAADINMEFQEGGDVNYENLDPMKMKIDVIPTIPTVKLVRSADGTFKISGKKRGRPFESVEKKQKRAKEKAKNKKLVSLLYYTHFN